MEEKPKVDQFTEKRDRAPRTEYTAKVRKELNHLYSMHSYLTLELRKTIAEKLTMTEEQVKIWFQNKRSAGKRNQTQPHELLQQQDLEAISKKFQDAIDVRNLAGNNPVQLNPCVPSVQYRMKNMPEASYNKEYLRKYAQYARDQMALYSSLNY